MDDQNFVELSWIIGVLRRWWWLISGFGLLAGAVAYVVISMMTPVYESSVLLLVNPSKNSNASQYNDLMAGTQLALTYSKMVKDRPVLEAVISELGLVQSASELSEQITAEPVRSSQIINLTVTDSNPEQAALIANTLAQAFIQRVEELFARRYAGTIQDAFGRMEDLQFQITELQAKIDLLRTQKVTKDVALASMQTSLTTLQSDYRAHQNSYQDMQLTVAEVTGKVYIFEQVQVQTSALRGMRTATAVVSVGQIQSTGGDSLSDNRIALTYGQLMMKPPLLQGVINELGLTETIDQLSRKISVEPVTGTQLIRFNIEDEDGIRAQLIAESLVNAFVTQVKAILVEPYSDRLESLQTQITAMDASISNTQTEIGKLTSEIAQIEADLNRAESNLTAVQSDYREALRNYNQILTTAAEASDAVIITEPAQAALLPIQNRIVYVVLAAFFGIVIGTGLSFFIKYTDVQIRTNQDVRSALNLPVLSTIGLLTTKDTDLFMNSVNTSNIAEDFHILSNKIRLINENSAVKTLLVTSPAPGEGKSIIVSNLAIGLSNMGLRIVIVDADLRLPRLHKLFGLSPDNGLTDSMSTGSINGTLQPVGFGTLKILTSGMMTSNPAEVLNSPVLAKLLAELKANADLVIVDCPPVLVASDASILASKVDGVLLVLRAGQSEIGDAQGAVEALQQVNANLVGIVLNSVPKRNHAYYRYTLRKE